MAVTPPAVPGVIAGRGVTGSGPTIYVNTTTATEAGAVEGVARVALLAGDPAAAAVRWVSVGVDAAPRATALRCAAAEGAVDEARLHAHPRGVTAL